ncbi:MAG: 8-hydroxy-5-deazaflavin:NADPH oxidoreductase [Acidimicrobiaceae bacterium]|nr:8-hydroxy-5-deazaflavin:NADPH oxidoreductase [Acidimicrobiaceae bacterium]MDQ1446031.1 8-hydroxy-5-deazaflavin:NADPH oxidoreductase [Acidimicrobiaceae bacterium]
MVIGSRSKERAAEACEEICKRWPERDLTLEAGDNSRAAAAEIVIVATPWDAAALTVASVAQRLTGKVVISMANALAKVGDEFEPLVPPRGSVAAHVQSAAPGAMVAAAFHHLPAKALANLNTPIDADVLVCSDHVTAFERTAELVELIPNLRPLNAGSLSNAAPIEAVTAVLLQLNVRYKTRAAVRLTGIELPGK